MFLLFQGLEKSFDYKKVLKAFKKGESWSVPVEAQWQQPEQPDGCIPVCCSRFTVTAKLSGTLELLALTIACLLVNVELVPLACFTATLSPWCVLVQNFAATVMLWTMLSLARSSSCKEISARTYQCS